MNRKKANNKLPVVMYDKNLFQMLANPWFLFEQAVFICSSVSFFFPCCKLQRVSARKDPNISRLSILHLSTLSCLHLKTSVLCDENFPLENWEVQMVQARGNQLIGTWELRIWISEHGGVFHCYRNLITEG